MESVIVGISAARRALLPAPTLPLVYFGGAHVALALAFASLLLEPGLPGSFHYHPRLIAVLHLVTLGWMSGSILGALGRSPPDPQRCCAPRASQRHMEY
jgi:hypothetical protein